MFPLVGRPTCSRSVLKHCQKRILCSFWKKKFLSRTNPSVRYIGGQENTLPSTRVDVARNIIIPDSALIHESLLPIY